MPNIGSGRHVTEFYPQIQTTSLPVTVFNTYTKFGLIQAVGFNLFKLIKRLIVYCAKI